MNRLSEQTLRKSVSAPGLLKTVRQYFDTIPDSKQSSLIPLTDHLMSGLAIFGLKYPSLLQFDQDKQLTAVKNNLRSLYGIEQAPCDTYLRERLDELEPQHLRRAYTLLFKSLQRAKGLEDFACIDDHYLLSIDGTGYFSSQSVHCESCCKKTHRNGDVTYYHQLLGAVLVHPQHREVFPLAPEPMIKQDGQNKNDCERNAAKRLLKDVRREHPHLKLIVVEDALASNGPHIQCLKALNYRFILGAKESDHTFLFEWISKSISTIEFDYTDEQGIHHRFRYLNGAPLNDTHFDLEVNFLEYWETKPNGKSLHFSWVTDIPITSDNLASLMRAGRARWRIENETFNTLKNHGYHFEHNFGHGNTHLSTVMVHLMMLAFLIDQIQQRCCKLFNEAWQKSESKTRLWQKIRGLVDNHLIRDWQMLYSAIAYGIEASEPVICNSS